MANENEWLAVAGGALSAVGNVAAQAIAGQEDKYAQRRAFEYNKQFAAYQNDMNIANWHMQNEYNSPTSQMARLRDAGLNPNLVYNNGSAQQPAASLPAYPGATMGAYQGNYRVADALGGLMDNALKMMGILKQKQEIQNLSTSQRLTESDITLRNLQATMQRFVNAKTKDEKNIWKQKLQFELDLLQAQSNFNDAGAVERNSKAAYNDTMRFYTAGPLTRETNSKATLNETQAVVDMALLDYRKNLLSAQAERERATASRELSQVGLNQKLSDEATERTVNYIADRAIKGEVLTSKQLENAIDDILVQTGINLKGTSYKDQLMNFGYSIAKMFNLLLK